MLIDLNKIKVKKLPKIQLFKKKYLVQYHQQKIESKAYMLI